jgi:hypothetical protein
MKLSKTTLSVFFSIVAVLAVFVCLKMVQADTGSNMSGYFWSSNIGWIDLNDCSDPTNAATCTGPSYGVSVLPTAPGTISGYAWSPNIGWITFNDPSCPLSGCTPGAHATWNSNGSATISGWARACSVFASGCSGTLKAPAYLGSCDSGVWTGTDPSCAWDGYIALDSATAQGAGGWGLTIGTTGTIGGYAWGSQVIGWIQSINAKVSIVPIVTFFNPPATGGTGNSGTGSSGTAGTGNTGTGNSGNGGYCTTQYPQFAWDAGGATSCSIQEQGGGSVPVAVTSQAAGGSLATDGKYYFSVNLPVTSSSTVYTLACTGGSAAINIQQTINTCTANTSQNNTPTPPNNQPPAAPQSPVVPPKPKPIFNEF